MKYERKNSVYNTSLINHNRASERIAGNKTNRHNYITECILWWVYTRYLIDQRDKEKVYYNNKYKRTEAQNSNIFAKTEV